MLDDDTPLPDMLGMDLVHSPFEPGVRAEFDEFFGSRPEISECARGEVYDYLDWIDHWKEKGAKFHLSM